MESSHHLDLQKLFNSCPIFVLQKYHCCHYGHKNKTHFNLLSIDCHFGVLGLLRMQIINISRYNTKHMYKATKIEGGNNIFSKKQIKERFNYYIIKRC